MRFVNITLATDVAGIILFEGNAHAYLDPGTGSMILQGILGGIAAVAVVGRLYWDRLKRLLGFSKHDDSES